MLHLRIITPPELTATVLQELVGDPGVTHITVNRGAATQPAGDLVACDVVRASVNPLLRRLRAAGVTERGGITLTELEAVISAVADRAQAEILTPEIEVAGAGGWQKGLAYTLGGRILAAASSGRLCCGRLQRPARLLHQQSPAPTVACRTSGESRVYSPRPFPS